jgi:predicted TIM-barrel fold metal-dependent hydrolase
MDRLMIFSGDGHAGASAEAYRPYLDEPYRALVDDLIEEQALYMAIAGEPSRPTEEALQVFDDRGRVRGGGALGGWDIDVRLAELDADGIAGELIHAGHQNATLPFFGIVNKPVAPDVRAAGRRAYHRWLAEFMAGAGGRLVGVAEPGPCLDMDETIRELTWVAEHGFVSVSLPGTTADPDLPPLHDPHFEPFFAACEDLGLVLSIHAGFGLRQGVFFEFHARIQEAMSSGGAGAAAMQRDPEMAQRILAEAMGTAEDSPLALDLSTRRPLWLLMAGGVFDRHPGLRLALTEVRGDWVPATIAHLDERMAEHAGGMKLRPSEYYRRHIFVAPSSIHRAEVEMREAIGVDQLLFGADYPHPEGTWPNTREWIRNAFDGVPEDEVRQILGENAVRTYGLDAALLAKVAARIGPSSEILADGWVDESLVRHFDQRAGYRRAAETVDVGAIDTVLDADLVALGA